MSNQLKNILHLILLFFFTLFVLNSNFIQNFRLFGDYFTAIQWLECKSLGFNLFSEGGHIDCEGAVKINYGYAFLSIPYNDTLSIFYEIYLPYILIFLFIYLTVKIINPNSKLEVFLLYLAILNPSTIFPFQRLNLDCVVFIVAIIIVLNRLYFVNWFLGIYLALIKVYPIILLVSIFIENKERSIQKIFSIILIIGMLSIIYLYIYKEFYIFFSQNFNYVGTGYHFLFSLNSIPKILKYVFDFNYIFLLFIFYSLFIILNIKFYKKIDSENNYLKNEIYTYESKFFIVGGYLTLFIFMVSSNYFYKEVFLILLIPYIFKIRNTYQSKLFNILIFIFIIKYLYSFIYAYINLNDGNSYINGQRIFSNQFLITIFLKSLIDYMLMIIVSILLFIKTKIYINDKFKVALSNSFK